MSGSLVMDDRLSTMYEAYAEKYEHIMERRFQLLTLVPGSTVASFAIPLISDSMEVEALRNLIFPLGLAGTSVLVGLFIFMYVSLIEANVVAERIRQIEKMWGAPGMLLYEHPIFNHKLAIGLIFAASLAGWICVAFWFVIPGLAIYLAIGSFFVLLIMNMLILANERLESSTQSMFSQVKSSL